MQETKGNSENTPAIYDWLLDLCEVSENWSLQNSYWQVNLKEIPPSENLSISHGIPCKSFQDDARICYLSYRVVIADVETS